MHVYKYGWALGTPGVLTTSATPNTEVAAISALAAASNTCAISKVNVIGRGDVLTTLSGLAFRIVVCTTASSGGTAITPSKKQGADEPAALATMKSRQTIGTGRSDGDGFGCNAAGAGFWQPNDPAGVIAARGGSGDSVDIIDVCATASKTYEVWGELEEA
jgi:putative component of membrane protein insertase Oxa1/YidC/SpoIIIJ protein YidD